MVNGATERPACRIMHEQGTGTPPPGTLTRTQTADEHNRAGYQLLVCNKDAAEAQTSAWVVERLVNDDRSDSEYSSKESYR